jgi:hypothetical protein
MQRLTAGCQKALMKLKIFTSHLTTMFSPGVVAVRSINQETSQQYS